VETILDLLAQQADVRGTAPALFGPDLDFLGYRDLFDVVRRLGASLAAAGAEPRARIALVCSNGPHMATAFLGVSSHAACAPLNPSYRAAEFEFYLSDLAPRALLVERDLETAAREAAAKLGIPQLELGRRASGLAGDVEIAGRAAEGAPAAWRDAPKPGDVALLLHTSGTTSRPKLVPLTQANLCASARNIAESLQLRPSDRCLNVMPLFHIHGLEAAVLASLTAGAGVVCCPGYVAPKFFGWVEEFQPTWYTAVPTIHQSVLARAGSSGPSEIHHSFRFIRSCSSALAPSLMRDLESAFGVPVIEAYGMTEAAHQMASNPLAHGKQKPGSVGIAAGPEIAIMDDQGRLLDACQQGEVVIRGPNVTAGYAANPEANGQAFTGGWFRTGDDGYLDSEGYLFLAGRRKEMINRGGEKIAPREIDEVLLLHSAIAEAVAFSIPHAALGETVAAAVVFEPGHSVSEDALREFAWARLADFKVPEKIVVLDHIPKGPSGKVQRIGLAARLGLDILSPARTVAAEYQAPVTAVENHVAALFAETLGRDRVGMRDNFFELGGDSLLTASLISRLRDNGLGTLSVLEILADPTPAGICRKLALPRAEAASTANRLATVVRPANGEPVLFCVPGSFSSGDVTGFVNLARHLDPPQPLIAFRLPDSMPGEYQIEELAARYIEEILEVQPEGPYFFAGNCTGGLIVWELARQLAAQGKQVGAVALFDCYNRAWAADLPVARRLGYRIELLRRRMAYQFRELRRLSTTAALAYLRTKIADTVSVSWYRWIERACGAAAHIGIRLTSRGNSSRLAIRVAAHRYAPRPLSVHLELFRAGEPRVDAYDYPEMGWQGLADTITVHEMPGGHMTMLAEPNVQSIAASLKRTLNPARQTAAARP